LRKLGQRELAFAAGSFAHVSLRSLCRGVRRRMMAPRAGGDQTGQHAIVFVRGW
jgi:hypothetical protein